MDNLIAANIRQRPLRTAISVLGVGLGVILVMLFVGLANGMMGDAGARQANVEAEVRFQSGGNPTMGGNALTMPAAYAGAILNGVAPDPDDPDVTPRPPIPGVIATSPVGSWLQQGNGSFGYEFIDGIDFATFTRCTSLQIVNGRGLGTGETPDTAYEAIVDRFYSETNRDLSGQPIKPGSRIVQLGQEFTVVGIYEPSMLARIKIPLRTLQQLMGGVENCSYVMVKCERPELADQVIADIKHYYPGNNVIRTDQIPALYSQSFGAVEVFLNVVIGLAVVISALVILLAMYTTIVERTREIGILKSLGASKGLIIRSIEKEAGLISVFGVGFGFLVAVPAKFIIEANTRLKFELQPRLMLTAALIGILGGLVGALYPAFRAASLDPVEAISYE